MSRFILSLRCFETHPTLTFFEFYLLTLNAMVIIKELALRFTIVWISEFIDNFASGIVEAESNNSVTVFIVKNFNSFKSSLTIDWLTDFEV